MIARAIVLRVDDEAAATGHVECGYIKKRTNDAIGRRNGYGRRS